MKRFVEGVDRALFPECLKDWIDADKDDGTMPRNGPVKLARQAEARVIVLFTSRLMSLDGMSIGRA